ncbi:MAG: ribosomal protein S18-alanine N-acetyltransferase, partial [Oscillospiraceae bacterium]|nr:ribosomal protein S18-alanine N-acetyltransferase [Oscillospiraceae bacterium]
VLGYAGLHAVMDEGYLDNIAVREDYRGNGIADDLMDVFVRFGREHLSFLTLEVRPSNEPAIQLYYKHGFAQVGRRKDYYRHPKEDAIIMTLEFDRGTEEGEG